MGRVYHPCRYHVQKYSRLGSFIGNSRSSLRSTHINGAYSELLNFIYQFRWILPMRIVSFIVVILVVGRYILDILPREIETNMFDVRWSFGAIMECVRAWKLLNKDRKLAASIYKPRYHGLRARVSCVEIDRLQWWTIFNSRRGWQYSIISIIIIVIILLSANSIRFSVFVQDGQLRLWNEDGKPVCSWITHQGASIRSISVDEAEHTIVTGGGDGGIHLWPLPQVDRALAAEKVERIRFNTVLGLTKVQDIPRRIVLSRSKKLFTVTNRGYLLCYENSLWQCVVKDDRFADYCLLQVSKDRRCISLASIRGDVLILRGGWWE